MSNNTPIVIGNLMLGRCFTIDKIPFIGVTSKNDKRIFYTKYCVKGYKIENPSQDIKKSYEDLLRIVDEVGTNHPLYYSNDGHLKMIRQYYHEIKKLFKVILPSTSILDASLDKNKFIQFAKEFSMPVPFTISNTELGDLSDIELPVIIKPIIRINWFESQTVREFGGNHYKVLLITNREMFEQIKRSADQEGIEYIIQKYIPGPESNIISFHTFFTSDSEPLGYFVGRKIRTYPTQYGLSCSFRLIKHPEVVRISLDLLKKMKFVGPIKIDYKLDEETGKIYLLELNPRYNMWHYLGARSGINLPALAFRYYTDSDFDSPLQTEYRTDIKWVNVYDDFLSFNEMRKVENITFFEWIKTLKGKRVYQTLAFDDVKPIFYGAYDTLKRVPARIKRIFS